MNRNEALEKLEAAMRLEGLSSDTRKQYRHWTERYLKFIEAHRSGSSQDKFAAFLTELVRKDSSYSNKRQGYYALRYFYKAVLGKKMDDVPAPGGKRSQKIFNVLSRDQVRALIAALPEDFRLIARLLYGTGMRIDECLSLRTKDLDFEHRLIYVQAGKGDKARRVDLPPALEQALTAQIEQARILFDYDAAKGQGGVYIPHLYAQKNPGAAGSFEWFWLFPNPNRGRDPESNTLRRHHVYDFTVQKAFKLARAAAHLPIYTTPHILRHTYATHYLEKVLKDLPPIPNIGRFARDLLREKMGHVDASTTDIYIHLAMPKNIITDHSPLTDLE